MLVSWRAPEKQNPWYNTTTERIPPVPETKKPGAMPGFLIEKRVSGRGQAHQLCVRP
jgi:hypothetical protein